MTSTTSTSVVPSTPTSTTSDGTVLVCAVPNPDEPPQLALADGSYETEAERVFWKTSPDEAVLRIPLQSAVSTRPVRHFGDPGLSPGEQRLLAAIAEQRRPPRFSAPRSQPDPVRTRLADALRAGQVAKAEAMAGLLCRREGLAAAHEAISTCLAEEAERRGDRERILPQRTAATTVRALLERLRALTPEPSIPVTGSPARHQVVLGVAPGDPHTMALTAVAHQLQEAGHAVLVVEDVPLTELASLVARDQVLAVVVSAHLPWPASAARAFLGALRSACPETLLVVGGPGAPNAIARADLVTSDVRELLEALRTHTRVLTPREREILLAVAEGLTTNEIARQLDLSPATVRTHLDHVFTKTGAEHRAAAVARALRRGWIT